MLQRTFYRLGQHAMRAYAGSLLDMDVRFTASLPAGPKILAANHPSTIDPFLLLTITPEVVSILVTEFCFALPLFGRYLRAAGHIPVAHHHGRPAFDEAVHRLNAGHTIGIFPEGALSPIDGGVGRAHTGAARLALTTRVPVIPVGIALQRERLHFREAQAGGMTETARWYFSGKYGVTVGEPLFFDGDVTDRAGVRAATEQIMHHIIDLSDRGAARLPIKQTASALTPARREVQYGAQ
ncbi:1-acyl-sn-glycerol-3-phosphate acyltransferase [Thermoflexales bacterium]|nr:1-acyl-sn-glycerol-3-phosphate acyltransferase [Thermoflexales bacterium]